MKRRIDFETSLEVIELFIETLATGVISKEQAAQEITERYNQDRENEEI